MCVVCQGVSIGVAALVGVLPVGSADDTPSHVSPSTQSVAVAAPAVTQPPMAGVPKAVPAATTVTVNTVPGQQAGFFRPTCGGALGACPTPTPLVSSVDECKVVDATPGNVAQGDVAQGFPRPARAKPGKPVLNVLVVPVRYADSTATEARVRSEFEVQFAVGRTFIERNSYGRVTANFTLEPESMWVTVPETAADFVASRSQDLRRITQEIVSRIPRSNLRDFDSIFIVAAGGTWYWGGMDQTATYSHPSGPVDSVYFQTGPANNTQFPHNLGHTAYYMEDLYLHPANRTSPSVDVSPLKHDVMSSGFDFTAYNRWLAGFLLDSEVRCVPSHSAVGNAITTYYLRHVNTATGEKLLAIPQGAGRAIYAELIDRMVHVYELDSRISHGAGPITTIGQLTLGETVRRANVSITFRAVDTSGVYLEIQQ